MKDLYIIGAGSVGGHIACNIKQYTTTYTLRGFFDDDPGKRGKMFCGFPVIGPVGELLEFGSVGVVIGIAFPKVKEKIFRLISQNILLEYPTFISSAAWVSQNVSIGRGCIIYPGCAINYGSCIDDFVVMNMNCAIGHDCRISNFSSLAPGVNLGGHTVLGKCVDVGIGACTIQQIQIGEEAVVGGQAMITRDVAAGAKVVGVPGKIIPS